MSTLGWSIRALHHPRAHSSHDEIQRLNQRIATLERAVAEQEQLISELRNRRRELASVPPDRPALAIVIATHPLGGRAQAWTDQTGDMSQLTGDAS